MRNTAQYILKRLLYMIPMVLVITFLIYGGLELTPGDAISHMIPPDQLANVNPEQLEALRESYGLNDPFLLRYVRWLGELLHGNFGYSITSGVPIKDILLQLFPATLELSLAALAISSVLGSIPSFRTPFVLMPQALAPMKALPALLAEKGYKTSFFNGSGLRTINSNSNRIVSLLYRKILYMVCQCQYTFVGRYNFCFLFTQKCVDFLDRFFFPRH